MPLCICYTCNRTIDCDASGQCELCEIDAEGTHPPLQQEGNGLIVTPITLDREIHVILKQLHRQLHGPERECRWQYSDKKQYYWCQHVMIPARDVTEAYWQKRTGVD